MAGTQIYLLDTNAISDLMRPVPAIEQWLGTLSSDDRVVTSATVRGEILFGIQKLAQGRRRSELETAAHRFLSLFPCEPVPAAAGDYYAAMKNASRRLGLALDENDLWIAATSQALGATLVTRDADFTAIVSLRLLALR